MSLNSHWFKSTALPPAQHSRWTVYSPDTVCELQGGEFLACGGRADWIIAEIQTAGFYISLIGRHHHPHWPGLLTDGLERPRHSLARANRVARGGRLRFQRRGLTREQFPRAVIPLPDL